MMFQVRQEVGRVSCKIDYYRCTRDWIRALDAGEPVTLPGATPVHDARAATAMSTYHVAKTLFAGFPALPEPVLAVLGLHASGLHAGPAQRGDRE